MISGRPLSGSTRKTISILDRMKSIGLSRYVNLPRIVLCGEQSSGKTSLIESITGLEFLGAGEKTLRPIELKLVQSPGLKETEWIFDSEPGVKYTDARLVAEKIAKENGKDTNIEISPLKLTIYLNECPDLTLVDLPGISRAVSQNGEDREKITTELLASYCADDPRAIILCVIPANIDLSTSRALYLAKQWDTNGDRTIVALTKVDLMDEGTNALEVLSNKLIPLKHGYYAVKCRSKQDLVEKVTIFESLRNEQKYFKLHDTYRTLPNRNQVLGVPALTTKISQLLYKCIKTNLPLITRQLTSGIQTQQSLLSSLGPPLPNNYQQKLSLLYRLVSKFCEKFKDHMKGRSDEQQSQTAVRYSSGVIVKMLFRELYLDKVRSKEKVLGEVSDEAIDRVIRIHQGDTVPGFPSIDAFTYLISPLIEELREPVELCVSQIDTYLRVVATEIVNKVFLRFPDMAEAVCDIVEKLFEERKDFTLHVIYGNLESELNYILTNDLNYQKLRTKLIPEQPAGLVIDDPNQKRKVQGPQEKQRIRKQKVFINQMRLRVQAYYSIVLRNMRDIIPKNIGHLFCQYILNNMELYVYQGMMAQHKIIQSLGEPKHVAEERAKAQQALDTLKRALYFVKTEIKGAVQVKIS